MSLGSDKRDFNVSLIVKGKVARLSINHYCYTVSGLALPPFKQKEVFDIDTQNLGFVRHVIGCVNLFIMRVFFFV